MTGILLVQLLAQLLTLGLIFLDGKNDRREKWRRFRISIPTLIVSTITWYILIALVGPKFNFGRQLSDGDIGYLIGVIYLLSIITTLLFTRWYARNY